MRSLSALSYRSLIRRKGRYALTAAGTALGVAVLFGVLAAGDATTSALDRAVNGAAGEADVIVRPVGSFDATLPGDLTARLAAVDGVEVTAGALVFRSSITSPDEAAAGEPGNSGEEFMFLRGIEEEASRALHEFPLVDGRMFDDGAPEVVLSRFLAGRENLEVGDPIKVAAPIGVQDMTVSGILADAEAGLADTGRVAYTSLPVARAAMGKGEVWTAVEVALAPGVSARAWIDQQRAIQGEGLVMIEASDLAADFRTFVRSVNAALTLMSAIALFVGGFLIFLTFSLAVTERTAVFGTLRALGAVPRQVRRLVVVEAALLGLLSSIVGLVLGYGIAAAVVAFTESLYGIGVPGLGVPTAAAVISVGVAVAVSAAAAWVPARRAAALSPVTAMRVGAAARHDRAGRPLLGGALVACGVVLSLLGLGSTAQSLAALVVLLGAVLLVPVVLRPLAHALGAVTGRIAPGVGAIAVMHLVKERSRSAYTLALVMVVLAMILTVGASNTSMARTLDDVVTRQAGSGLQVFAAGAFDPAVEGELAAVPGVATTSPLRVGNAEVIDGDDSVDAFLAVVDPVSYFEVASLPWLQGDDRRGRTALAAGGHVMLPQPTAHRLDIEVGDQVEMRTAQGIKPFTLAGTYAFLQGFGAVVGVADSGSFGAGRPNGYLVGLADGTDAERVRQDVLTRLGPKYDLTVETAESFRDQARSQLQSFFGLAYAMLIIAAIVGMLGLANTLVVSVLTRTREIGILRSTGALRRQIRGMVVVEAATLALVALVLALPLAWALSAGTIGGQRATLGFTVDYLYPWILLPPLALLTLALAGIAALIPARRAGRLEVVAALRFD